MSPNINSSKSADIVIIQIQIFLNNNEFLYEKKDKLVFIFGFVNNSRIFVHLCNYDVVEGFSCLKDL